MQNKETLYEAIGGFARVERLVDIFYSNVKEHSALYPIFPADLTETARKQKQFLTQFLGGPSLYTEEHGHPRLRARHLPFPITRTRAMAWLSCMEDAMDEIDLEEPAREEIMQRLTQTAQHMINTAED